MDYGISTGEGHQITIGLSRDDAMRVAQREANRRGEAVYVWPVTGEEARDEDEVCVEPSDAEG